MVRSSGVPMFGVTILVMNFVKLSAAVAQWGAQLTGDRVR